MQDDDGKIIECYDTYKTWNSLEFGILKSSHITSTASADPVSPLRGGVADLLLRR